MCFAFRNVLSNYSFKVFVSDLLIKAKFSIETASTKHLEVPEVHMVRGRRPFDQVDWSDWKSRFNMRSIGKNWFLW